MGWGLLFPEDFTKNKKKSTPEEEQLVICYLSINRDVALARVMYQPPGGFYPVVLLPAGGRFALILYIVIKKNYFNIIG